MAPLDHSDFVFDIQVSQAVVPVVDHKAENSEPLRGPKLVGVCLGGLGI